MKAFKAGVCGVLRVSAYGCETTGELLCVILRVSGLTVSLQSAGQLWLPEKQRLRWFWQEVVAALLAFVMLFYAMRFAWCLWRAFGLSADFGLGLSWAFSSVAVMDGNISLPSLFASFLLYNFRDVFGNWWALDSKFLMELWTLQATGCSFARTVKQWALSLSWSDWWEKWPPL